MMPKLSGPTRPPASGGKPKHLVILLHGLGADGNDLIGLAPYLAPLLPEAEFLSPNAPFPCDMAPYGYQWYSSQDRSPGAQLAGVRAAAPILDAFIDQALAERGLEDSALALVGFSQGSVMSLFVGPRRAQPVAGIVGYSGRLVAPDLLPSELRSRPPILSNLPELKLESRFSEDVNRFIAWEERGHSSFLLPFSSFPTVFYGNMVLCQEPHELPSEGFATTF